MFFEKKSFNKKKQLTGSLARENRNNDHNESNDNMKS